MIDDKTPLAMLTVGDLKNLLSQSTTSVPEKRYVFGVAGIRSLLHVGTNKAIALKNSVIREAVSQHGRKIIVDAEKALELYSKSQI